MKTVFLLFSLLISHISFAQKKESTLATAFKIFETDAQFKHALISLYVVDSKTGKVVFDKNSQIGLAPASCLKVVTSAAAFELLGKDYRYKTELGISGDIKDGHLNGSINITGYGDPALGSWRYKNTTDEVVLNAFYESIAALKIRSAAEIMIDNSKWGSQTMPGGWTWDDMGNYYGAGSSAFNWNENQYNVNLKPGKQVGDKVDILSLKPYPGIHLVNELTTAEKGTGDRTVIYFSPYSNMGFIRGTIPRGIDSFQVAGSSTDGVYSFSTQFLARLNNAGITIQGPVRSMYNSLMNNEKLVIKQPQQILSTIYSPPLDSINYWFLQKSVNLYGEAFVKTIAYEKTGFGATDTGINIIQDFWAKNGIERSALHNIDGSGLSPANRITTNALVTVMQYAQKQSWFPSFYKALPNQNNIKMKSGYIGGVRSYTGYIKSRSGAEYTFAFIINNYDGNPGAVREKMWKLLDVLK